jgi:hypothetical protein
MATHSASHPTNKLMLMSGMPDRGEAFAFKVLCQFGSKGSKYCNGKNRRNIWA